MARKAPESSSRLGRFLSNTVILAAVAVFAVEVAIDLLSPTVYADSIRSILFHYVFPVGAMGGLLACLRLSFDMRASVALSLAAVVPALYGAEFALGLTRSSVAPESVSDRRSKIQVIADLRAQGIPAYPVMRAKTLLLSAPDGSENPALTVAGKPFLPLASLPKTRVVACNEGAAWMVYDSDRHGFHNPDAVWDASPLPLAMVGDSFAHGSCVASDQNIAAHLRRRQGAVLNLGISGFGPVSELASLKEYLEPLRPKTVLWLFFEGNDITEDTAFERRSPLLMSYVKDASFSQGLFKRADEITRHLKTYLDERLTEAMARFDHPHEKLMEFLILHNLRERLGLNEVSLGLAAPPDIDLFRQTLASAKRLVGSWGGRLIVVYLPDSARYFAASHNSQTRDHLRQQALKTLEELDLPVVDVHRAFASQKDVATLFQYPGSHYSNAGYRVAAEAIEEKLAELSGTPSAK